jgi:thiosulfate reductase cytochrome b subunit
MHWINALAIIVMIGSGWRIYNYYPALPIHFGFPNYLTLGGDFTVTEALNDEDGLANALAWHFGAMWVLVINFLAFVIVGFASGHFRRDFLPVGPRAFLAIFGRRCASSSTTASANTTRCKRSYIGACWA